jgi:hypothetical protein
VVSEEKIFQQYFRYIIATRFSGGGRRREPPTLGKKLISFITCSCELNAPFLAHLAKGNVSFCHHCYDISEILLKVALNTINKSINQSKYNYPLY